MWTGPKSINRSLPFVHPCFRSPRHPSSLRLFVHPSVRPFVYPSVSVSVCVCLSSLSLSICLYIRLSVCLSVSLHACLTATTYLPACRSVCLSVRLSVCPSVCPSVCLFICLSVRLSGRPSVCLSVHLSVCLFICLSIPSSIQVLPPIRLPILQSIYSAFFHLSIYSSGPVQLSAPCNHACNCSGVNYVPVCGGPLTFFSPCHAGCSEGNKRNEVRTFVKAITMYCICLLYYVELDVI